MARYSIADVETYSPGDIETPPPPPKSPSWLERLAPPMKEQGDYGMPGTGMSREGLRVEGERLGAAGAEVAAGAKQVVSGEGAGRTKGASRMYRGAMSGAGPYVGLAAGAAFPAITAYSVPVGMATDYATEKGMKAVGVPEGPAELASDIFGLLAPVPGARAISRMGAPVMPQVRGMAGETRVGMPPAAMGEPMGPMPSLRPPRPLPPPPAYLPGLAQRKAQAQTGIGIPSGVFKGKPTPLERTLEAEIGDVAPLVPGRIAKAQDMRPAMPPMSEPSPLADAVLPNRLRAKMPPRPLVPAAARTYRPEDIAVEAAPAGRREVVQQTQPPQRELGNIDPIDAGPVPKGPKSAAESAEVLARENPPVFKSAKESAEVFGRGEEPMRREPLPVKPKPEPQPEPVADQPMSLFGDDQRAQDRDIFYLPTDQIKVDPARFQFKSNVGAKGVSDELKGVEKWDPAKGGVLAVWKDPKDGNYYVANGHHRHELASRVGVPELPVVEVKARDAVEARAAGALINIADGKGTAVDAAKVLRDLNMSAADLEAEGISLKGALARDATGLSGLPQNIFDMVAQGDLDVSQSAVIGDMLRDRPLDQTAAFNLLDQAQKRGKRMTPAEVREMISLQLKGQPEITETQTSLFGDIVTTRSVLPEMAKLSVDLRKQIGSDKRLFSLVADESRSRKLSEAGNQLDTEGNANVATQASQVLEVYDRLSGSAGPVTDALTIGAERIANGENTAAVRNETYDAIRSAVEQLIGNPRQSSGGGVGSPDAPRGGGPKRVPTGGATLGSGLGALQPYYDRFVAPHVKSAAAKVPAIRDMISREMVDRYSDQQRFEKKAASGSLPFDQSVYAGMRMYAGTGGKIEGRLNQVADALRPLNDEKLLDAAMKYGELERHEELGARLPDYKMPDGRTPADATADRQALEATLGQQGLAKVQRGLAQYRAVMNDVLTEARDAGLISSQAYDSIVKGNEKYIPFERVMQIADELGGLHVGQRAFSVASQDVVRTIKGSEREIANPIEASIRKLANTISLIERNKVARKQADLANLPEFANEIKRLPATNRVPDEEKFSVLIDGRKVQYQAPREIVAAMKHMDVKQAGLLEKVARASAGMLRAGATELNPAFHIGNVIRDYQTATLATQGAFTPLNWAKGFAQAIKRGDLYKEFEAAGGSQSGVFLSKQNLPKTAKDLVRSKRSKVIRTVVNPVQLMRVIGQTFELAPRLGTYDMARKGGKSAPEAAFAARNATVDFSRVGNTMQIANMLVPFINARLQGTLNQYKAIGRDVKGSVAGPTKAKSAALLAYKLGAVAGLLLVATYLHNIQGFPQEWDSIDQQEKDKNFILIFGKGRDEKGNLTQALKIPKGEIQALVNPTENFLEYMRDRDAKGLERMAMEMGSNLSPVPFEEKGEFSLRKVGSTIIPPDIKAGTEWITNQNIYTGRDIVPRNMEKATPANQWDEKTPLIYRKAGEVTGLSPKKLENTVSTKLGGAGRYAAEAADAAFGDTGAPADTAGKMAKRFIGAYANAATTKDYEQLTAEDRAEADLRLSEERAAKTLISEIKALPAEQRGARLSKAIEDGTANPQVIKRMVAELKGADKNRFDESLRIRPARERAQYIVNNLKRLPPERRAARFQQFIESKVLTSNVAQEMKALMGAQAAPRVPSGTY